MNSNIERIVAAAFAALAQGKYQPAEALANEALQHDPGHLGALTVVGKLALLMHRPDIARQTFERILRSDPSHADTWISLSQALTELREDTLALETAAKAVETEPDRISARIRHGELLISLNRLDEAAAAFEQALALSPEDPKPLAGLARARRPKPGDPLIQRLVRCAERHDLLARDRALLLYALAQAHKGADPERFIHYLMQANRAQGKTEQSHRDFYQAMFDRLQEGFSANAFARAARADRGEPTPIFILGMPRSGTTLVEQLLCARGEAAPGGELNYMRRPLTPELEALTGKPFPLGFELLSRDQLNGLAEGYRRRLRLIAHGARWVTDKTPANFHLLGLLVHLFPDAPIVHTVRDPMDTCFSILQYPFDDRSPHTWDMTLLGEHYVRYKQLMAHWEALFPGRIHTVQYEALVADPVTEGARLFAHCGLAWHEANLDFHKSSAPVRTFSAEQVRQPIYLTSIGAWRPYADALEPLRSALAEGGLSFQ